MKVNINPDWTLVETVIEARKAYVGIGITSKGYRNSVLKVWANMVGKKRALSEINALIDTYGSNKKAAEALEMSTATFYKFLRGINELPDPAPTRKPKLFLCHANEDKPKVHEIYLYLKDSGYDVWFDEESLIGGQNWEFEIKKAVSSVDLVIVCLSPQSRDKIGYVQKEISLALDMAEYRPEGKDFIIPLKLEECQVPDRLSTWQWVDLFEENGYDKLMRTLEANEIPIE